MVSRGLGHSLPEALLRPLGVDFHDPGFWEKGFEEIRGLVGRAEKLALHSGL